MNKKRCEELLEYLKQLPDERFDYTRYLSIEGNLVPVVIFKEQATPSCNTAGCVAGHCCILYFEDFKKTSNFVHFIEFSTEQLGLTKEDANFLFIENMEDATKQDAIARLEYLIKNGVLEGYDFSTESYYPLKQETL